MAVPATRVLHARYKLATLQSCLLAHERATRGDAARSLSWIVSAISSAAKGISARLRTAGIDGNTGAVGNVNVQGEEQQALDVIANELVIRELESREGVVVLGSEENDELMVIEGLPAHGGRYAVMFDPLDGSSNLDVGGTVGTIFSVYEVNLGQETSLQPGRQQIAAGYVLYGPATTLVLTLGHGVDIFALDPSVGNFIRVAEKVRMPEKGKSYSVNEANIDGFPPGYQRFIAGLRTQGYASRYASAMVADVHRAILTGGIFMYPPNPKAPQGKLRLMYEANPMGWIVEQAGGKCSTGSGHILDVTPESLHQRVPVIVGSVTEVDALCAELARD